MVASRDLQDIFNSGEIIQLKIGGTSPGKAAATKDDISAAITSPDYIDFDPDSITPSWKEGRTFYAPETRSLSYYSETPNEIISLGRELVLYVKNVGTVTIKVGDAVYLSGNYEHIPAVQLAIADGSVPAKAMVIGVASHEILSGEYGFITAAGIISGVDLSTYVVGQTLYLSDTVEGGYTTSPGQIVTLIGSVVVNELTGSMTVKIVNFRDFPSIIGWLSGKNGGITITPTAAELTGYITADQIRFGADNLTGILTPPYHGTYRCSFSMSITYATTTSYRDLTIELYNTTDDLLVSTHTFAVPRDSNLDSFSFSDPVRLLANKAYVIRLRSDVNIVVTAFGNLNYDIESIRLNP